MVAACAVNAHWELTTSLLRERSARILQQVRERALRLHKGKLASVYLTLTLHTTSVSFDLVDTTRINSYSTKAPPHLMICG